MHSAPSASSSPASSPSPRSATGGSPGGPACGAGGSPRSNLAGSVAFGVSAVAAHVVPDSGQPRNAELVNLGTFVGAIGFLVGAFLLLPERTDRTGQVLTPVPTS